MTTTDPPAASGPEPAEEQPVWYKRTWLLVVAAIVVVVGASILIDLPRPITNAEDVSSQTASLKEINQDLAPCGFAIKETFLIHQDQLAGTLTPSDQATASKLMVDDQSACSFTNESVYDLTNNIDIQDTAAGKYIDRMMSVATTWVTSDALAAVEDIQYLYLHPGDPAKTRDLAYRENLLAADRNQAIVDVQQANTILHAHLAPPNLPALPGGN
jgi:type II secretory pathway pseudopilin PulG